MLYSLAFFFSSFLYFVGHKIIFRVSSYCDTEISDAILILEN